MNKEMLGNFIVENSISIVDAMKKIDENARGILFITDERGRLMGTLTDGDIRRWLIRTGDLSVDIYALMNKHPEFLYWTDRQKAVAHMKEKKITALPILDAKEKIIDILFVSEEENPVESTKCNALSGVPLIIMAGGKGTRLYPYTKILPKPLIPIGDIPIIERIINRFVNYGITEIYVTVNYKKSMIKSYFSDSSSDYSIKYVEEDKPLGTGGSLKLIPMKFDNPIIVTNCDILINADYSDIYRQHIASGNAMTIVSALKNIEVPYGVLHSDERGSIKSMEEKPKLSYFVNTGMYILNPELIEKIPENTFYHMTNLAEQLIREGTPVGMYPISEDSFLDMGELEEMNRMEKKLNVVED